MTLDKFGRQLHANQSLLKTLETVSSKTTHLVSKAYLQEKLETLTTPPDTILQQVLPPPPSPISDVVSKKYLTEQLKIFEDKILQNERLTQISKPLNDNTNELILRGLIKFTFNTFINKKRLVKDLPEQFQHSFKIGKSTYSFPIKKAKIVHILSNQTNFTIKINNEEFTDYTKLTGHFLNKGDLLRIHTNKTVEKVYIEMLLVYEYDIIYK